MRGGSRKEGKEEKRKEKTEKNKAHVCIYSHVLHNFAKAALCRRV